MTKLIVNCETGETVERELNKAEKDQQKIDQADFTALQAEAEAKATAKQAIADRLGLTADELKLLLG
jgi:phosphoribosylformylglycinamidine (FGAM) synthase PurS component